MYKKTNLAKGTLSAQLLSGGTSLTLQSGEGSLFPDTGSTNVFVGVLWGSNYSDPQSDANREFVIAYRSSGDTFTITRAQEDTSAQQWEEDDNFALVISEAVFQEMEDAISNSGYSDGWIPYSLVTPTRASADDPTYVLTFSGVDLTGKISVGMKVKFTQNGADVYGIVTKISFSTNTTLTLYCGTDYDVLDTSTYAIFDFHYSPHKAPLDFPLDPDKWTVEVTDTNLSYQSSPTASIWYNLASISIDIPIGAWKVFYKAVGSCHLTGSNVQVKITLSTANNSESDDELTHGFEQIAIGATQVRTCVCASMRKRIIVSSKTLYYLNEMTPTSGTDNLYIRGDITRTVIRAVCAYL